MSLRSYRRQRPSIAYSAGSGGLQNAPCWRCANCVSSRRASATARGRASGQHRRGQAPARRRRHRGRADCTSSSAWANECSRMTIRRSASRTRTAGTHWCPPPTNAKRRVALPGEESPHGCSQRRGGDSPAARRRRAAAGHRRATTRSLARPRSRPPGRRAADATAGRLRLQTETPPNLRPPTPSQTQPPPPTDLEVAMEQGQRVLDNGATIDEIRAALNALLDLLEDEA